MLAVAPGSNHVQMASALTKSDENSPADARPVVIASAPVMPKAQAEGAQRIDCCTRAVLANTCLPPTFGCFAVLAIVVKESGITAATAAMGFGVAGIGCIPAA